MTMSTRMLQVQQALGRVDDHPAAGQVDLGTIALTNGISAVPPAGRRSTSRSDGGRVVDPGDLAQRLAADASTAVSPTSWWSWNSSGSSGGGHARRCRPQSSTPRSSSATLRSWTPSNGDDQPALVPADRLDGQLVRHLAADAGSGAAGPALARRSRGPP